MARKTLRRLVEKSLGSEWERLVRRIGRLERRRVLVCWNRGLGDVALGMSTVIDEIRRRVPGVSITVLTRADLSEAFAMLGVDGVLVDASMRRRDPVDAKQSLARLAIPSDAFDIVIQRPDPTHWFRGQPASLPRLRPPADSDALAARFDAVFGATSDGTADGANDGFVDIAVHVQSETDGHYGYRKDWPIESWSALFARIRERHRARFVLFGHRSEPAFVGPEFIDLRGRTSLGDMLAVIRTRCRVLIAPDSGVLTMTYYLDVAAPLDVISLWADPRQGVLKRGVPSPNPLLRHVPLLAPGERIERLAVETVLAAVDAVLGDSGSPRAESASAASPSPQTPSPHPHLVLAPQ